MQTSDGGYALAGCTMSYGVSSFNMWLVKTDMAGNAQWNKTYGGEGIASCVLQTIDAGYLLLGTTRAFGAGGADIWLVKTDSAGNMQWNKTYGGGNDDYGGCGAVQTSDGGYALTGWTLSFGAGDFDIWLIKLAPERIPRAMIDIDPDALNSKSMGRWMTAYIQLPEGYSAADINATTILLNGTIQPVLDSKYDFVINSSEYLVDHNNDGIIERMVKFNRTEVESFIRSQGIGWGKVQLTVTG